MAYDRGDAGAGLRLGAADAGACAWASRPRPTGGATTSVYASPTGARTCTGRCGPPSACRGIDLYGFYPTVTVEAIRTESDVPLYDRKALTVDLGFRSSF